MKKLLLGLISWALLGSVALAQTFGGQPLAIPLPVAQGGTGQTSGTGTGLPVFQTTPTITGSPTVNAGTITSATVPALQISAAFNNSGASSNCLLCVDLTSVTDSFNSQLIRLRQGSNVAFSVSEFGDVRIGNSVQCVSTTCYWTVQDIFLNRQSAGVFGIGTTNTGNTGALQLGSLTYEGTAPTITGTGSPTGRTGNTIWGGEATAGATATSVVITFPATQTRAPSCVVTSQTQLVAFAYTVSTTAITITQTATSGNKIDWHCDP